MEDSEEAFIPSSQEMPFAKWSHTDGKLSEFSLLLVALSDQRSMLCEILERLPPTEHGAKNVNWGAPKAQHQKDTVVHDLDEPISPSRMARAMERLGSKSKVEVASQIANMMVPKASTVSMSAGLANLDDSEHLEDLPSSPLRRALQRLVLHPVFDLFIGFLIVVNTISMGIEEQYAGARVGYNLGFYTHYGSREWLEGGRSDNVFRVVEAVFAVIFTGEVILRMVGLGWKYLKRPSEWFDLSVVLVSDLSILFGNVVKTGINVQLLRLFRGAKLMRLVKLIRTIEGFDALHLMTTALSASVWALFWSVLLLLAIMTFLAMLVTNSFRGAYLEMDASSFSAMTEEQKDVTMKLFKYFGTFTRSMLSLFELALANWTPICRFLMDNHDEGFMIFVLSFKLVMGIAVFGVINAVFMQETFKVANTDDSIMVRMKMRAAKQHRKKMQILFKVADTDGSGRLRRDEFVRVLSDKSIKTWLAAMDFDVRDADAIFDLLRGSEETIGVDELIQGISLLKGPARSIDMRKVLLRATSSAPSAPIAPSDPPARA